MSKNKFNSVWDAIEDNAIEAESMKLRAELMIAIKKHIEKERWTQKQAAQELGITQPRISDLIRGKIDLFALDSLVNMMAMVGYHIQLSIKKVA